MHCPLVANQKTPWSIKIDIELCNRKIENWVRLAKFVSKKSTSQGSHTKKYVTFALDSPKEKERWRSLTTVFLATSMSFKRKEHFASNRDKIELVGILKLQGAQFQLT